MFLVKITDIFKLQYIFKCRHNLGNLECIEIYYQLFKIEMLTFILFDLGNVVEKVRKHLLQPYPDLTIIYVCNIIYMHY